MEKFHFITTKHQSHVSTLKVKEDTCSEAASNTCLYFKNKGDADKMLSEIKKTIYNFCKEKEMKFSWLTEEWVKEESNS